jgi:hypothetical protein
MGVYIGKFIFQCHLGKKYEKGKDKKEENVKGKEKRREKREIEVKNAKGAKKQKGFVKNKSWRIAGRGKNIIFEVWEI